MPRGVLYRARRRGVTINPHQEIVKQQPRGHHTDDEWQLDVNIVNGLEIDVEIAVECHGARVVVGDVEGLVEGEDYFVLIAPVVLMEWG